MGGCDNSLVSGYIKNPSFVVMHILLPRCILLDLVCILVIRPISIYHNFNKCHIHALTHLISHTHTGSSELIAQSAPQKTKLEHFPSEVPLEHFEMNTNIAYGTNTAEIVTTENVAYTTVEDAIPATQNVAYGQIPSGTDDCYDYIIRD